MIEGLSHVGDTHKCTVCSSEFNYEDGEGGINGYFGILPVAFCTDCYTCMIDMVMQDVGVSLEDL